MSVIYAFHGITAAALILKLFSIVNFSWFWFAVPGSFYMFIAISLFIANRKINNGGKLL